VTKNVFNFFIFPHKSVLNANPDISIVFKQKVISTEADMQYALGRAMNRSRSRQTRLGHVDKKNPQIGIL
jgi:hypothetical protein